MTKYLVVRTQVRQFDENDIDIETIDVLLCEDSRDVAKAIQETEEIDRRSPGLDVDWAVFEVLGKKSVQKSVRFKMDGRTRLPGKCEGARVAYDDVEVCD